MAEMAIAPRSSRSAAALSLPLMLRHMVWSQRGCWGFAGDPEQR